MEVVTTLEDGDFNRAFAYIWDQTPDPCRQCLNGGKLVIRAEARKVSEGRKDKESAARDAGMIIRVNCILATPEVYDGFTTPCQWKDPSTA